MALPTSGPISWSDIRTETQTTSKNNYSIAKAAWTSGSLTFIEYPPINVSSVSRPDAARPGTASEWYGYNHQASMPCSASVSNFGGRAAGTPYSEMWVVDLGTVAGTVNYDITIATASFNSASISCEYGYPYDSNGTYVGGVGGILFDTTLINQNTSGTFNFPYNAATGSLVYVGIYSITNSTNWPIFNITMSCPVSNYDVTFYSRAGDTIAGGEEYNLEYSTDGGTTWNYIAGPLNSTTCTQHGTFSLPQYTLVRAVRDIGGQSIYYNLSDGSSTCPPNNNDVCGGSGIFPTGPHDVAITVWVDGVGDFQEC